MRARSAFRAIVRLRWWRWHPCWNSAAEAFNVTLGLVRRGTEEQIAKIWSGNLLHVWGEGEKFPEICGSDSLCELLALIQVEDSMQLNAFKRLYPLFVLFALPAPASTFGVFTKVSSVDAGDLAYATAPGIAVGYGGGLLTNITQYETSYSSTVTQPGATTAGLAISSVYNQNTADSATAYASLASGIMRSQIGASSPTGGGITDQILQDSATFTVAGAPTSQIQVNAHLSGIATGVGLNAGQEANSLDFSLGGSFRWTAFVSNNGSSLASHFGPGGYYAPSGWDSYEFTNETVTGFDFTGLYTVTNG